MPPTSPGQIDARRTAELEPFEKLAEALAAEPFADLRRADVARHLQDLGE